MTPLPSPQQLRYLTALAEHQHFGRAADACAVTQSTLSAGILALERQLDATLLDRDGGKRVVFTPLGRDIVARGRDALASLAAVVETALAARTPMTGTLRLGLIPTVSPFLLPDLMPRLRAAFPALRLLLLEDMTERLMVRLHDGAIDLAMLALPCECAGQTVLPVARDGFHVALPPGHALAALAQIPASALMGERLLLLEDGHCLRDQILGACGLPHGARPEAGDGFAATSLHTLVQMVAGGLGITLLPELAVRAGITAGTDLVLRPLLTAEPWRMLGLAHRPNAARAADYRALAAVMAACFP